ncbi:MAG: YDG domain-containing protein [Verrucomicrobiota bacterium]
MALVSGDTVLARTNGYTANFADKNVGSGKALTVAGLTLTGTPAANYSLVQPTNLVGNITNRLLVVTASGVNKTYDGTTTATVTLTNDAVSGDVVTQTYTAAAFADKNSGTNKAVNVSGISITGGADAANYALSNTTEIATANILVLPVQLSGAHIYDAASNSPAADLIIDNNYDGVNVALSGNVTLGGKNVGAHAVTSIGAPIRVQSTRCCSDSIVFPY